MKLAVTDAIKPELVYKDHRINRIRRQAVANVRPTAALLSKSDSIQRLASVEYPQSGDKGCQTDRQGWSEGNMGAARIARDGHRPGGMPAQYFCYYGFGHDAPHPVRCVKWRAAASYQPPAAPRIPLGMDFQ